MSDESGTSPARNLSEYERLVKNLEDCPCPLSVAQRESAVILRVRICTVLWTTTQQRLQAHGLVLRLAMLGRKAR
jgi:hypothetical protein